MSEPVTNVEIEDVLTSIRRLVAEGNTPRTLVPRPEPVVEKPSAAAERFVLTPALRVADAPEDTQVDAPEVEDEAVAPTVDIVAPEAEPLVLEPASRLEPQLVHDKMTASERASLEATIAELEAAVTFKPDAEWEPDGSEARTTTGLAEAFAAMQDDIEDAEEVAQERVVPLRPAQHEPTFRHTMAVEVETDDAEGNFAEDDDTDYGDDLRVGEDDGMPIPDDLDETLAAYIAGDSALDRAEIRQMVVEVVRQELQGDLGERISRNIRKLVRREIQRATSANLYD